MARTLSFKIDGPVPIDIFIEEGEFDPLPGTDLRITATVDDSGGTTADLRGIWFDVSDENLLGTMTAIGSDVSDGTRFGANSVLNLGTGANLNGLVKKTQKFDGGVEIGSQGCCQTNSNQSLLGQ